MRYKNILFDLDGTLIDSAPGIEESFYFAYLSIYNIVCPYLIKSLIGPPIDQVLTLVNGETNIDTINRFVDAFKQHYDKEGYKKSKFYDDVENVLEALVKKKLNIFIATNKRERPTKLILEHLSGSKYFSGIYCPDKEEIKFKNKTELISHLLETNNLQTFESILIGDTMHDGIAAEDNKLDFAFVNYGYGEYKKSKYLLNNINQLLNIL